MHAPPVVTLPTTGITRLGRDERSQPSAARPHATPPTEHADADATTFTGHHAPALFRVRRVDNHGGHRDLGPPIKPPHPVPNGPSIRQANRVWCMLDLLLKSATITDAWLETQKRIAASHGDGEDESQE
jgi:hypothetical protein